MMPISATGTVSTPNAARYIRQLCSHWSHKLAIEQGEGTALIRFPAGAMTLTAADTELRVAIETDDRAQADQLKQVLQSHLDRFAFREAPLDYRWPDSEG